MKKLILVGLLATFGIICVWAQTVEKNRNGKEEVRVDILAETSQSWDGATLPNYPTTTPKITICVIHSLLINVFLLIHIQS